MEKYKPGEFAKLVGVTVKTLQNWDNDGNLKAFRTPTGRRYYTEDQYKQYMLENNGKVVAYCRIGVREQKEMMEAQKNVLRKYLKGRGIEQFDCVEEIGGGMELERDQFGEILHEAFNGDIKEILVAHADRFLIFGFDLFKGLLERRGVKVTNLDNKMFSTKEEWSSEMRQIIEKI